MAYATVENMVNPRSGREVPNQFVIRLDDGTRIFQSYSRTIARIKDRNVELDERFWDYSRTTVKYRNLFLRCSSKECQHFVETGTYKLIDLNS